ncbi:hypothetical protein, partial [uncultured Rikenella sp.]|uniref:hypothetical protein n=1 Tax=uncultured Rikenella sp. TaxID=368003 RepID=UPI00261AE9A6
AANYVTEGYNLITRPTTFPVAPAGGGTIQVVWDSYPTQESINALWGFKWASGARGSYTQALAGGTLAGYAHYSWTGASGNFTYLNSATGDVSVASKGTAVSGVTGGPTVYPGQTLTFTNHAAYGGTVVTWEDVTTPCSLQQAANHIVAIQLTPGSLSYASVSYAGGSSSPKTTYQDGWHFKFSSGATTTSNTVPAGYGTETIHNTWTGSAAGASIGTTWGEVVWSQNNSATSRSITVTRTVYNVLTPNAANYPGAPTVMSNTQTYVGICTQSGIPQSSELRYQYADQPSQYPRFIRNGPPSGSIERSYRSAIRSTRGSTVTYHDGTISNVAAYDLADYISTTNYSIGFNPYTGSEFINNYPYTYGTVSFTVTGGNPSRSFSCIALFEKNYRDYEAAGYPSWLLPIDPDNKEFGLLEPLALSSTECSVLRTLATEGVAVLSGDEAAEVDLVALSARINAARRPDTNRYVRQEDGTWTVIEEARRK